MPKINLSDGTGIWYEIIGNGPLIVFNHGYGSSHKSIEHVAEYLKENYTCLLYDQRGQGDSDKPKCVSYEKTRSMYSLRKLADDCYNLLQQLKIIDNPKYGKFFMYGHSMGGMISLLYALKYGDTLEKLGIGSTTSSGTNTEWAERLSALKNGTINLSKEYFLENAKMGHTKKFLDENPEFLEMTVKDKLKTPKDVTIALLDNFINAYDIESELSTLKTPVIVLHGKDDSTIEAKCGIKLHKIIQNSELALIKNQAHEINKELPETVSSMLDLFFKREDTVYIPGQNRPEKPSTKGFPDTIEKLDSLMEDMIGIFDLIGIREFVENEISFCTSVGDFTAHLNRLLDIYFENANNRELQLKFKPEILFYRQVQGYLVFLLRYPHILKVKEHDEIQQTIKFLKNKEYLIKKLYNDLAEEQTEIFENDNFKRELERKLVQKEK